jgi:hypothetical protein
MPEGGKPADNRRAPYRQEVIAMSAVSRVQVRLLAAFCAAVALLLLPAPAAAQGNVTCVALIQTTPPLSGTNCTLDWSAFTSGCSFVPYPPFVIPNYITHVTVTICGTQVLNQDYSDPDKNSYSGIIIFDSTHFADGTASTIQVSATNNANETGQQSVNVTVYNKAYVFGNDHLFEGTLMNGPTAIGAADTALTTAHHQLLPQNRIDGPYRQHKPDILVHLGARELLVLHPAA